MNNVEPVQVHHGKHNLPHYLAGFGLIQSNILPFRPQIALEITMTVLLHHYYILVIREHFLEFDYMATIRQGVLELHLTQQLLLGYGLSQSSFLDDFESEWLVKVFVFECSVDLTGVAVAKAILRRIEVVFSHSCSESLSMHCETFKLNFAELPS